MTENLKIVEMITDPAAAWGWMARHYLGEIPCCSCCGVQITGSRALASFGGCRRTWCSACGSRFNPAEGTPICSTSWRPSEYVALVLLLAIGASVAQIESQFDKSAGSIRDMIDRIKLCHPDGTLTLLFSEPVSSGIKRETRAKGGGFKLMQAIGA